MQNGMMRPSGMASWMQHRLARATSKFHRSINASIVMEKRLPAMSSSSISMIGPQAHSKAVIWPSEPAGLDFE